MLCSQSSMFAGSLFIQMALQWNMYASLAVLLIVTTLYTVLGTSFVFKIYMDLNALALNAMGF